MIKKWKICLILACVLLIPTRGFAEIDPLLNVRAHVSADVLNRWEEVQTLRMLDRQEQKTVQGTSLIQLQVDQDRQKERAKDIGSVLKRSEVDNVSSYFSHSWNQILAENPALKPPLAVMGVGVGLWTGRELTVAHTADFAVRSRIEARARNAWVGLEATLIRGRVLYDQNKGIDLQVSQKLPFDSVADVQYHVQTHAVSTCLSHQIVQHLAVTVSAAQPLLTYTEATGQVSYSLVF